jgi:hypothetical protein
MTSLGFGRRLNREMRETTISKTLLVLAATTSITVSLLGAPPAEARSRGCAAGAGVAAGVVTGTIVGSAIANTFFLRFHRHYSRNAQVAAPATRERRGGHIQLSFFQLRLRTGKVARELAVQQARRVPNSASCIQGCSYHSSLIVMT